MTFAKVFLMVIVLCIFLFTLIKLISQIKEYCKKKKCVNEVENVDINNKEVNK